VRYLVGYDDGAPVYRICEVSSQSFPFVEARFRIAEFVLDLASDLVKPYRVNEKLVNQAFELKHGKSQKTFNMDKVSNGPFLEVGFDSCLNRVFFLTPFAM